ncbi:MAG TPA: RNA polymerase factor sigma-54 [Aestuariivirgaceae bacterium]|jgi:RNA polymerase sigma-54 factor|nr:RNA polymerase factor sigma-54 [Aestuariivirgaceae bacterium]
MALVQKLEMRHGQSLVMTPQLQQAIKLLQMSNLELKAFIEEEIERNPLLERAAEPADDMPDAGPLAAKGAAESADEAEAEPAAMVPEIKDSGWLSDRAGMRPAAVDQEFAALIREEPTLAGHLTDQLNIAVTDPERRLIGAHLIGMVDEAGYLTADLDQIAASLGVPLDLILEVLDELQTFDPPGVFARDLRECLSLQLKDKDRLDPAMARLVDNLPLVARRDFNALRTACGVDIEDIKDMVAELRRLNPKPGNAFGALVVQPVIADVIVKPAPDGAWLIELNSETLPRLLMNSQYYAIVSQHALNHADRAYLGECQANANWLLRSLDQRARTILAVAREIVRQQDGFLVHGVKALRPLNLKAIADAISMHESTVSRVTSNKYMATPRGTFEMKYFFTAAISSAEGGDSHSAEAVRQRIREMVEREAPGRALSDTEIVDKLRQDGIDIARRTVAKYRDALGIPSSVQRQREHRLSR